MLPHIGMGSTGWFDPVYSSSPASAGPPQGVQRQQHSQTQSPGERLSHIYFGEANIDAELGGSPGVGVELDALAEARRAREAFAAQMTAFESPSRGDGTDAAEHQSATPQSGSYADPATPGSAEPFTGGLGRAPMTREEQDEMLQEQAWAAAERAEAAAKRDSGSLCDNSGAGNALDTPHSTGVSPAQQIVIQTSAGAVLFESPASGSSQTGAALKSRRRSVENDQPFRQPTAALARAGAIETSSGTVLLPVENEFAAERDARLKAEARIAELERKVRGLLLA